MVTVVVDGKGIILILTAMMRLGWGGAVGEVEEGREEGWEGLGEG